MRTGLAVPYLAYSRLRSRLVVNLPDCTLKPREVLRVHAGQRRDLSVLNAEDRNGADWHSFTGEDAYVWNNREGDAPTLQERATNETIDSATYDPHPPEGFILRRQGSKLVPVSVPVGTYR